jgi:hypothetical protein
VVAVPVCLHATDRLRFVVAAGFEHSSHGTESLVKVGVDYILRFGRMRVAPLINVDFVDRDEILIFGVNVGFGF